MVVSPLAALVYAHVTVRVRSSAQRVGLQLKATLENVTSLGPSGEDFRWYLKVRAVGCSMAVQSYK